MFCDNTLFHFPAIKNLITTFLEFYVFIPFMQITCSQTMNKKVYYQIPCLKSCLSVSNSSESTLSSKSQYFLILVNKNVLDPIKSHQYGYA